MTDRVWCFFYGGLINPDVMKRVGLELSRPQPACLAGYELRIEPLVNLVPNPAAIAFGLLAETSHRELSHVYGQLKAVYLPFPVLTHKLDGGGAVAALCYIVPEMPPAIAEAAHIIPLLESAGKLGFPEWYVARIRSFLPSGADDR